MFRSRGTLARPMTFVRFNTKNIRVPSVVTTRCVTMYRVKGQKKLNLMILNLKIILETHMKILEPTNGEELFLLKLTQTPIHLKKLIFLI